MAKALTEQDTLLDDVQDKEPAHDEIEKNLSELVDPGDESAEDDEQEQDEEPADDGDGEEGGAGESDEDDAEAGDDDDDSGDESVADDGDDDEAESAGDDEGDGDDLVDSALEIRARALGLSDEELAGFQDSRSLSTALSVLEGRLKAPPAADASKDKTAADPAKKPDNETPQLAPWELNPDDFKVPFKVEDKWNAEFIDGMNGTIKKVVEAFNDKLRTHLVPAVQGLATRQQQADLQALETQFDAWISKLPKSMQSVLGDAPSRSLADDSAEAKARQAVLDRASTLTREYMGKTGKTPPFDQVMRAAFYSVHPDKIESVVRRDVNGKVRRFGKHRTARPTHRTSAPVRGTEAAVAEVAKILRRKK